MSLIPYSRQFKIFVIENLSKFSKWKTLTQGPILERLEKICKKLKVKYSLQ